MSQKFLLSLLFLVVIRTEFCIAVSNDEFWLLKEDEKKQLIESALKSNIEKLQNFSFEYETDNFSCEFTKDRAISSRNKSFNKSKIDFHRIGKSFLAHRLFWYPENGTFTKKPTNETYEAFDANTGVLRTYHTAQHLKEQWYGLIANETSSICKQTELPELLDFSCRCDTFSILNSVIKNSNTWRIIPSEESSIVVLEMDDTYCEDPTPQIGTRKVWLDIAKNFSVLKQERDLKVGKTPFWLITVVKELKLVSDVWVPSVSLGYGCTFDSQTKGGGVEYKLLDAKIGKSKSSDIGIVFPQGTKVFDKIRGIEYFEGDILSGDPTTGYYAVRYFLMISGVILIVLAVWRKMVEIRQVKGK